MEVSDRGKRRAAEDWPSDAELERQLMEASQCGDGQRPAQSPGQVAYVALARSPRLEEVALGMHQGCPGFSWVNPSHPGSTKSAGRSAPNFVVAVALSHCGHGAPNHLVAVPRICWSRSRTWPVKPLLPGGTRRLAPNPSCVRVSEGRS